MESATIIFYILPALTYAKQRTLKIRKIFKEKLSESKDRIQMKIVIIIFKN